MATIRDAIEAVSEKYHPATVRQVYYQLVSRSVIEKTEAEYKTVCRLLGAMRREGRIPFDWIADNTRWMRKPTTHRSLDAFLRDSQRLYRRDVWADQHVYCEVWLEKEALAGVLYNVTAEWDVPLMVTRGYPSISFLHSAAEAIQWGQRPTYLYYFGDHDPSGVDIPRFVESAIRELAPDADLHFERVAVTPEQITDLDLPTRPTKRTDTRSRGFDGESVEVDAIDPSTLKAMCERCITQHIDEELHERMQAAEAAERDTLSTIIESMEAA